MEPRRVVVTGLGVISTLGRNCEEFWDSLRDGRSGIGPMKLVNTSELQFKNAAEVSEFVVTAHFDPKTSERLDRFAQFAVVSAREAVAMSALNLCGDLRARTAVVTGSCVGGQTSEDHEFQQLYGNKRARVHPLTVPKTMANAGASAVAAEYGITGPVFTLSTACSSSTHALGQAYWLVRHGTVDAAIAGGSEAPLSLGHLKAWESLRLVAPDTCRPFSRDRRGMILGEGSGMIILETLERAAARNAIVYGEIVGFGMSTGGENLTRPSVEGPEMAMRAALEDAHLNPEQIGYVNAHGTGTEVNDVTETLAIRRVFGPHADRLAVSSTKSMHGHTLGAAGAMEAVATILALREWVAPPTANYIGPDSQCDLDVVPNHARALDTEYALSNSFAFGGLNAVLAFRRWTD